MLHLKHIKYQVLLFLLGVSGIFCLKAQTPTYTIDNSFNSGELFRSVPAIGDLYFLEDGKILVGGSYTNDQVSVLAMIFGDGTWDNSWGYPFEPTVYKIIAQEDGYVYPYAYGFSKVDLEGMPWVIVNGEHFGDYFLGGTNSPYNFQRSFDIFQQENGDLLIGGAIGTDTLQPGILRGLARIHADGTHDPTLPTIDITPNNASGAIRKIFKAPDGSWYVSGSFTALNGHQTNHVAKLTADFQVDTDFVSPFMYDGPVPYTEDIILVDNQSRVWVSGYDMRLLENSNDTIQIIRLLPDGEVDESFLPRYLENNYPEAWYPVPCIAYEAQEIEAHPGNYFVYGAFNTFEDTTQPCITVVNDAGIIQEHFFQGQGATTNNFNDNEEIPYVPTINAVEQMDNGDLLIGGAFSEFMGETYYSLIKLNPGFLGTSEKQGAEVKIFPNPAKDHLQVSIRNSSFSSVQIIDNTGKVNRTFSIKNTIQQIDLSNLSPGIYFMSLIDETGNYTIKKIVIQ